MGEGRDGKTAPFVLKIYLLHTHNFHRRCLHFLSVFFGDFLYVFLLAKNLDFPFSIFLYVISMCTPNNKDKANRTSIYCAHMGMK